MSGDKCQKRSAAVYYTATQRRQEGSLPLPFSTEIALDQRWERTGEGVKATSQAGKPAMGK